MKYRSDNQNHAKAKALANTLTKKGLVYDITPSTFKDFKKYLLFDSGNSHGNGVGYLLQMLHGVGSKKYNMGLYTIIEETFLPITIAPSKDNPNVINIYVVRPVGKNVVSALQKFTRILREFSFDNPVYVKKLFQNHYEQLLSTGFKEIKDYPWSNICPAEDDTLPEIVIDPQYLDHLYTVYNRKKQLKRSLHEVQLVYKRNKVEFITGSFIEQAWNITTTFFENLAGSDNISSPNDYINLISYAEQLGLEYSLLLINGKAVGYYILETDCKSDNRKNMYALMTDRSKYRFLSNLILFHVFENNRHYYINLGGSENQGIHSFKYKFEPVELNKMYWAVLPGRKKQS